MVASSAVTSTVISLSPTNKGTVPSEAIMPLPLTVGKLDSS